MNNPFQSPSNSLVAPTSASESLAGHMGAWLLAQPMLGIRPRTDSRSAIAARPCASRRWWAAGSASKSSARPGACMPIE